MVKRSLLVPFLLAAALFLTAAGRPADLQAQDKILIKGGDDFPEIALKAPAGARDRGYLGISGGDRFTVKDIRAQVILVEILNVYCGACQRQAPLYNRLFSAIQADPAARKQIKLIGIAVGNDDEEVRTFRSHFKIPYPIIADTDYSLHAAVGGGPTPFSLIVRRDPGSRSVLVADAHLGTIEDVRGLFKRMKALERADPASIRRQVKKSQATVITLKPPIGEEEIRARVQSAFTEDGGRLSGFEAVSLKKGRVVYTGVVEKNGGTRRLFAQVVSEVPTCDECHETHFIYTFEADGKIRHFIPIQLTKYGNEDWDEADIGAMRRRIVGRYIYRPFSFKAKVDAVTSATITSAAIFRGLNEGQVLFEELKARGLL
jgi:hypothetical protein